VLLCPGLDLAAFLDGTSSLATDENFETTSRILSWYVLDHPVDDPLINSLKAELSGLPPLLIQAATGDSFAPEARLLAQRAAECGVEAVTELYPVDTHDFQLFWSFLPEAQEALTKVGDFVARTRTAPEQGRGRAIPDT
jgi:monoterpene epsilon-lactone hydrolase